MPQRTKTSSALPKRVLSKAYSVLYASTRTREMRKIFKEKLEGNLRELPTKEQIEKQASAKAETEVFFQMRREFMEDFLDFPETVLRHIHEFGGAKPAEKYVPDLSRKAIQLEAKVQKECKNLMRNSIKDLASNLMQKKIDEIREKLAGVISSLALDRGCMGEKNSVRIKMPHDLKALLKFNKTLTEDLFKRAFSRSLSHEWKDFGFMVLCFDWSGEINITPNLCPPKNLTPPPQKPAPKIPASKSPVTTLRPAPLKAFQPASQATFLAPQTPAFDISSCPVFQNFEYSPSFQQEPEWLDMFENQKRRLTREGDEYFPPEKKQKLY